MKIDIPNFEGLYQYDTELNQVLGIKRNKYLKNKLNKNSGQVELFKNGKGKKYNICQLSNMCNLIENNNLVDIPKYNDYKFDLELSQVYNLKTNMYLKYNLCNGYYQVGLHKNNITKTYGLHQLVYICNNPTEDISDKQINHIDGNIQNNKIENLRKATRSENMTNRNTHKNNKLGIKYIHKNKYNTYTFKLVKNKIRYEKNFKNLEEAIEHRDRVVREICGEFTRLD